VPFNFAVVFDFNLFPVPTSKSQFIGNVLMNRQNAAIRSMVSFLFYNAHCLLTHCIILRYYRRCVVNRKKSAKNLEIIDLAHLDRIATFG
jgi:hypothetical protein